MIKVTRHLWKASISAFVIHTKRGSLKNLIFYVGKLGNRSAENLRNFK